ncbi:Cna B-type domain-containing protein [Oscillibacter valericigenes]|uniref:Cna B-type domain-containing protein n=1 Tax=Oscillibacter valericigenes TaxID=351091 RepID=A0ABS2FW14_9FIRM|nr:FctA domain-containing protein [Oscillibacter valericigenes]MBM6851475.1 Cna B-type domain-containing protein [Oscillibacter valericigenes]
MEAVKRNVCRGVIFLMACLTCVVVFGGGLIAEAAALAPYATYTTYACDLGINVTKTLIGREFREGDEFTFKIEPQNEENEEYNKVSSETVTIRAMNNGEGLIPTGNTAEADDRAIFIKFTWPGEYVYCISEVEPDKGALPGIIYDQTKYKVTVTVGVKEDPVVDPSDPVENNITLADGGEENGLSGDGDNQSGGDDAQSKESVQKELEVTNVKVEKYSSSDGEWPVVYDGPPLKDKQYCAFTNIYGTSVGLTGTKTLSGRDFQSGDTFTFTITREDGAPAPVDDKGKSLTEVTIQPTSGEKSAEIDFGTIYFTPEVLGGGEEKTFTYMITEKQGEIDGMTYDTAQRTVLIEVKRQDDGSVTAEVVESESSALSWTNTWDDPDDPGEPGGDPGDGPGDDPSPSYTSLTVNKEWILDDGGEAPVSVTVELLRNNRVYKEVTLDEDNDWSHTWTRLDGRFNWKVQEADVPDGFTAEVSHRGTIWTITNDDIPEDPETPPEEPDEPDEPDTPEDPVTPDEPDVPDTPDTPDEPNTPNEPTLPQTGQNWRLVWILAITGAVLVLVGILGKKGYHGKHEA